MNQRKLWQSLSGKRRRASSWDHSGGNADFIDYAPHEKKEIFKYDEGPGCILRIWFTFHTENPDYLSSTRFSFKFDSQMTAAEVPVGMLLASGPWAVNDVQSSFVNVMRARRLNQTQGGVGFGSFNLCLDMPFLDEASIIVHNDSDFTLKHFYYVDYQTELDFEEEPFLFHATHNRAGLTKPAVEEVENGFDPDSETAPSKLEPKNRTTRNNHVLADLKDYSGNYVGTFLVVESHPDRPGKWYEGDDMFLIDGETWPPILHGTGTEGYFGMAWGIHRRYQALDHGVTHFEKNITDHDRFFDGCFGLYRWHVDDPINFSNSLHASIEAGHANDCSQYYESVAYWYGRKC